MPGRAHKLFRAYFDKNVGRHLFMSMGVLAVISTVICVGAFTARNNHIRGHAKKAQATAIQNGQPFIVGVQSYQVELTTVYVVPGPAPPPPPATVNMVTVTLFPERPHNTAGLPRTADLASEVPYPTQVLDSGAESLPENRTEDAGNIPESQMGNVE
ncbi:hypothetical protein ABW19_dt0210151 [Dactylella cylindrospora]|nr:hypothetical protein ABW19_dt0210151 [Dactylella cylindrospora]